MMVAKNVASGKGGVESAIIAVGYKVNSELTVQFRKWATRIIQEFTMDDERLKNNGQICWSRLAGPDMVRPEFRK